MSTMLMTIELKCPQDTMPDYPGPMLPCAVPFELRVSTCGTYEDHLRDCEKCREVLCTGLLEVAYKIEHLGGSA
jgi:hypothetical protein